MNKITTFTEFNNSSLLADEKNQVWSPSATETNMESETLVKATFLPALGFNEGLCFLPQTVTNMQTIISTHLQNTKIPKSPELDLYLPDGFGIAFRIEAGYSQIERISYKNLRDIKDKLNSNWEQNRLSRDSILLE